MEGSEDDEKAHKKPRKTLQAKDKGYHFNSSVVIVSLSFLVAVASIVVYLIGFDLILQYFQHQRSFYDSYYEDPTVNPEIINLFISYDENRDGKIDPKEFVQIAHRMFGRQQKSITSSFGELPIKEKWDQSGEKITMKASFKPLVLSTMTKFSHATYPGFDQPLEMLKSWRQASKPTLILPVSAFSIFLPAENTKLGESWYVISPETHKYDPSLPSLRYVPTPVHGNAVLIHYLLSMFHPRPFTMTRLTPQGTAACIEAFNEKFLKIAFRIHAEFQINEPPLMPFWFSPAQFAGTIVISRDGKHVHSFNMAVPNNRSLNVDMEWLMKAEKPEKSQENEIKQDKTDETNEHDEHDDSVTMEVDIGYVPQMEINSNGPSCIRSDDDNTECPSTSTDNIAWESELKHQHAEQILMKFFYPFQKVPYLPFKEAFKKSKELNKPVHHILLWGALDDQSC